MTVDKYKGSTTTGISIGDESKKVINEHGDPNQIINTTQGELYIYDSIIFFFIK